jgi:uncharacterized protein (DUF302 family)
LAAQFSKGPAPGLAGITKGRSIFLRRFEIEMPSAYFAGLFAFLAVGLAAVPSSGADGAAPLRSVTVSSTTHVNFRSSKPFDAVTAAIEKQLGKFDATAFGSAMMNLSNPAEAESKIHAMEGSSGFMLFAMRDHGQLLGLKGRKAFDRQYEIGNPLIAVEMTQADLRAGEYAPLRICVYVGEDQLTYVDYDLPSTIFGRFKSVQVDRVAKELDHKLETLITNALKD